MKKTLVVVSALVALAIAAPALPGDGSENTDRTQDWHLQTQSSLPDTLKRERKSPSVISTSSILNNGVPNSEVQNVHMDAGVSTPTGRSFTLKKPLIVKKKYGYQVYRNSEEEKAQADSSETCGRQVKVKFCNEDDKLRTSVTGSAHEGSDIHTTEDDVKHSIKMAKEAVENLQRDLKKMETKTDMKMAHESQSDTELHEDIEVARQALKHIHENFETLESMSLHATTTRNSEDMHDVHVTIAKTEEERMAQWKEALENIQKNVEIARNIEDSFKAASNQDSALHMDHSETASTVADKKTEENMNSHAALSQGKNLSLAQDGALETHHQEKKATEEMILNKEMTEHLGEHAMERNTEDDMNAAPSEMIEIHLDNIKSQEPLRSENHKIHEHEKKVESKLEEHNAHTNKDLTNKNNIVDHHKETSSELNMDMLTGQSKHNLKQVPSMKAVEEGTETTSTIIKPLTLTGAFSEHKKNAEQIAFEQKKSAGDGMTDSFAKSADHSGQEKIEKEDLHKEQLMELAKAAKNSKQGQNQRHALGAIELKHLDSIPKSAEKLEHTHFHNLGERNEKVLLAKSVDHTSILDHQKLQQMQHKELSSMETVPEMKAAEGNLHHLQNMHNAHWAHENRHLDHLSSMKAAEEMDNEFRMAHGKAHGHGIISEPSHPSGFHHDSMTHSQMHEMGGMGIHSNFHSSMRDAMEGFGSDQMFRWKPAQESARGAYGSGYSSSSGSTSAVGAFGSGFSSSTGSIGAVGVFPNANIGGCSIPLLLSCSPSVVSGSLAKAHSSGPSSYSSPSYRTEEDFGSHNKRDIKKTNDMKTNNVLISPTIVKQKNSNTLENKM